MVSLEFARENSENSKKQKILYFLVLIGFLTDFLMKNETLNIEIVLQIASKKEVLDLEWT